MRLTMLSVLAAGMCFGASAVPAVAYDYPYCLQSRAIGIPGECAYQTYAQCQASASGRYATCAINPRVAFQRQRGKGGGSYAPRYRDGYPGQYDAPGRYDRW
jgi:hypothetical protein